MPSIVVDTRWFDGKGIGRFAREVVSRLSFSIHNYNPQHGLFSPLNHFKLPLHLHNTQHAAFFTPGINPPIFSPIPTVFVIHDLIQVKFPAESNLLKKLYFNTVLRNVIRSGARVLTVSDFSKTEIVEYFEIHPQDVTVVGNAVDQRFTYEGPSFDPGYPYILYIGNSKPHKNLKNAVRGFAMADIPENIKLILSINEKRSLKKIAKDHGLNSKIVFKGFIPSDDLPSYYRGARLLLHPSLYEGFGLTLLESMASGTPVAASNKTAIPEVVGDAGILFDPLDPSSISSTIESVLCTRTLYQKLLERGLLRADQFSWSRVAQNVESVIQETINT